MAFYKVKHKATGRIEVVDASDRRVARNAVAMDAFEVELATAEDGFRLAKEGRAILVAGAVKDPDQPTLPLDPPVVTVVPDPDAYLEGLSARSAAASEEGAKALEYEAVPAGGAAPPIVVGLPDLSARKDSGLLVQSLEVLNIRATLKIVDHWTDEERAAAWDFATEKALTDEPYGVDEIPDFLRIYLKTED